MAVSPPRNALASLEQVYVADRDAWRRWLAAHHATSPGIWLVFDKKSREIWWGSDVNSLGRVKVPAEMVP